jgi:pimeloyl-ACP methyl ester carboxylesterase
MDEPFSIIGETGLEVRGLIARPKNRGTFPTVILAPDMFDTAQSPVVKELGKLFLEKGFAVVLFDFTNSFGTSDGRGCDITISQRARDLEIILEYVRKRPYVSEKRTIMLGIGFGGTAALALEGFKAAAKALVLVNAPTNVEDTAWTRFPDRDMLRVRLKRYFHVRWQGKEERINATLFEDAARVDLARCARNLTTPTLILTGAKATVTPLSHALWLDDRAIAAKHEHVVLPELVDATEKKEAKSIFDATNTFLKRMKIV